MTYKIAHKLVHIDNRCLKPQNQKTCHQQYNTFQIQNRLQEIIYPQTIADWNALPEDAVTVPSCMWETKAEALIIYKHRLARRRKKGKIQCLLNPLTVN